MTCQTQDCDNYQEGNTQYCASCNHAKRKALRQALKPVKKPKSIAKIGAKRKPEMPVYSQLRKEYLSKHQYCEIKLIGCMGLANQIHHAAKRGANYLNVSTWLATCENCHNQTERVLSAKDRREKGLLL